MSCSPPAFLRALPLVLLLAGCGHKAPPVAERFAILRFESLSADASADWIGRALSEIIAAELPSTMVVTSSRLHALDRTVGPRPVTAPGISTERSEAILEGANRIGYGDCTVQKGGRIDARLTVEDPATGRMTQVISGSANDVVTLATELAHRLSPKATTFDTRNPEAVKNYAVALETREPAGMARAAEAAVASDPNFPQAYRLLSDARLQLHDRDGALTTLDQALARGKSISDLQRAYIEFQAANLRNDYPGRERALAEIAKANPTDFDSWRTLGDNAFARHDYGQAVDAYRQALQIHPDELTTLNSYGYAQAYNGDLDGGLRTLQRYQTLQPKDANALDSEGDVNLMYGRLREAENLYLQADKLDRKRLGGGDLLKAAMARLMSGDSAGASDIHRQFVEARAALKDPALPIHQAEWLWISGNKKAAREQMSGVTDAAIAARAQTDLAFWSLTEGDRAGAAQWAAKAGATVPQSAAADLIVARFLSLPSASAAEWSTRANQLFHSTEESEAKDLTLGYALLLDHHFPEAAESLRRAYNAPSQDPGLPVLLAWSLAENGHTQEAAPPVRLNPIPPYAAIGPYTAIYLPRLFELRKKLGEK